MSRQAIKGPQHAGYKLAYAISFLCNPLLIAVFLYLTISLRTASHPYEGLLWWIIICLGVSIAPILFIRRGVVRGKFSDHDISKREQRLIPILFALGCMAITLILLIFLHVSERLLATFVGMIGAIVAALLITQFARWKISLHLIGITGAVLTLSLLVSPKFYFLAVLIAVVGWARWRLEAHTIMQTIAGVALAAGVTAITFRLFGL
ncbi:hypothetical protein [Cohnella luojiensis]|uniref:Phosphatase PAP2 family protein n=1 Tax=Cohnella luojiensis TaxID=652876 RepID=A0A4Y8LRT8_9BACL|nr:hypothetical protein [Cohnella luojiensis]TFE22748.1 hypothetical protein E2980_20805 [Cohnella luojiensis]